MKTISNITFDRIDRSIPEGQLLSLAIAVICFLQFRDKKPSLVLEVLKDIKLNPFVNEPLDETMKRIIEKYQSENN